MTHYTMFVWSAKKLKRVDCSIVKVETSASDIASAKYTKRLVSSDGKTIITVLGTGDKLADVTLSELARAFVRGEFTMQKNGKATLRIN